uniref:SCAN box domain-containing protein n=1 Tax=Pygocentrus nattereri TaxID=42514 RepID=A0AAR2IWM4_PYGNA
MPTLKETDDIEHFLTTFERLAQAAQWPVESWALHLIPLLEGKARAAYVAMDAEDACDYQKVKSAVLRKYEINKETYRQRFRDGAVRANETPRELYTRLKGLYEKWMTPREKTKEQIGDTIIMEQYLKMVNPELRSWIIERSPTSTDQAVTLAEAYIAARQAEGKFRSRITLKLW